LKKIWGYFRFQFLTLITFITLSISLNGNLKAFGSNSDLFWQNKQLSQTTSEVDQPDDRENPGDTTVSRRNIEIPRSIHATEVKTGTINLDGSLDESIWQNVNFTSNFTQRDPHEGNPSSEKTKVAFVYDGEALYIGARMYSDDPSDINAVLARRDNPANSERLIVSLDTYLDRRTAYSFAVTAAGVRIDYYQPRDEMSHHSRDYSYDPVWSAKTHMDSLGWTAEMRIPFTQLRYSEKPKQQWGLNINRYIPTRNEDDFWVLIPKDETGWASKFGLLDNIKGISQHQRIEFLPYIANDALINGTTDANNPFSKKVEWNPRLGGNFELGLGPNLTLDATVNPDFGQVEADPAQVNLSAFETSFDEKRPFFTKGQQLLQGGGAHYFYSRRIGASPSYHPDADYVDMKKNTSILEATKLTGRLPSGLSVGGLAALTGREFADLKYMNTNATDHVEVEPLTGYGVTRLQQEFGPYSSTAGFILTGVRRDLSRSTALSKRLTKQAYTGASDWNLRFLEGKYVLRGDAGFSYVSGDPEAITRIQKTSAHYFQRPDASHVHLDTTRTSLSGYRGSLEFAKRSGEHWLWSLRGETESPEFELNDIGIMRSTDQIQFRGEVRYRENTPTDWYQEYDFNLQHNSSWNYGGTSTDDQFEFQASITWPNFWGNDLQLRYDMPTLDDRMTRGGPLMGRPRHWGIGVNLFTDRGANTNARMFFDYDKDSFGGYRVKLNGDLEFRTGGRWEFTISPYAQRRTDARQYITTLDNGPQATFGNRYIFSFIDRTRISTQFRINYAFNPDLSIELYAEPFTASGNYYKPGELPKPRSSDLRFYGEDGTTKTKKAGGNYLVTENGQSFEVPDPDFLVHSFRSNLVIRYQWRPGSTFYLVWQQNKFAREDTDVFVKPGDLVNALGETGQNMLAIKFTYWIPVK